MDAFRGLIDGLLLILPFWLIVARLIASLERLPAGDLAPRRVTMGLTGDAADLMTDPIVNLRDAHLVEIYQHLASAHREGHLDTHPEQPAPAATTTKVDIPPSLNSHP